LEDEFEVIGIVPDGHRLIEAAQGYKPDVLIVDIGMPSLNGLNAAQRIKRNHPDLKIIYLTVNQDQELMKEAFRTGASAFLSKKSAGSELLIAIRTVLETGIYISPGQSVDFSASDLETHPPNEDIAHDSLTDRQLEVLQLLAEGNSMKEVAAHLNVATRTVAFHKYRFMQSLNLKSDADIVQYAIRKRIIFDPRISR
jgi:DNA-binding NarL/FixJ family response regulator